MTMKRAETCPGGVCNLEELEEAKPVTEQEEARMRELRLSLDEDVQARLAPRRARSRHC